MYVDSVVLSFCPCKISTYNHNTFHESLSLILFNSPPVPTCSFLVDHARTCNLHVHVTYKYMHDC